MWKLKNLSYEKLVFFYLFRVQGLRVQIGTWKTLLLSLIKSNYSPVWKMKMLELDIYVHHYFALCCYDPTAYPSKTPTSDLFRNQSRVGFLEVLHEIKETFFFLSLSERSYKRELVIILLFLVMIFLNLKLKNLFIKM